MKNEYVSISEFAKRAGVSRQAVYSRLDKDLSRYCQVDNGKKTLNIKALALFEKEKMSTNLSTKCQPVDNAIDTINLLQKTVNILEEELKIKNSQISDLQKENQNLSRQLLELSGKIGDSLQMITKTQFVDKMIEGRKIDGKVEQEEPEASQPEASQSEEKKWWKFWK